MNNRQTIFLKGLILLFFCCVASFLSAQVFPGDANNNGKVDNIDILYMGYAYGSTGPIRPEDLDIVPQWPESFPDGINLAYADANGDGLIDAADMLEVFINYNEVNENVEPVEEVFSLGTPDFDPQIDLIEPVIPEPLTQGGFFQIPISLGSEDNPVENLNGLAFTIEYDPDFVQFVDMEITASWLDFDPEATGELFSFQSFADDTEEGEMDIAFTRFGLDPVTGHGEVGVLSIVIEDNLIGLLNQDSATILIKLKEVKLINGEFVDIPVVNDSLSVMVYHPDALSPVREPDFASKVKIFPNPVKDHLFVDSPVQVEQLRVYNLLGQLQLTEYFEHSEKVRLDTRALEEGIYIIRIYTSGGQITRKITIENN